MTDAFGQDGFPPPPLEDERGGGGEPLPQGAVPPMPVRRRASLYGGRQNRRLEDTGGKSIWLITFTDVMGLMLTFFVLLFAMAEPEPETWSDVRAALNSEFNKYPEPVWEPGIPDRARLPRATYDKGLEIRYLDSLLEAAIRRNDDLSVARVMTAGGELLIALPPDLIFDAADNVVRPAGRDAVYALGDRLSRIRNRFEIVVYGMGDAPADRAEALARAAQIANIFRNSGYEREIHVKSRLSPPSASNTAQKAGQINIVIKNYEGQGR